MNLDASQLSAIEKACTSRVSIITGGAGTGKTTIIKAITERLEKAGEKVNLCAFAGKAAARIREACEHPASTIHRMLGFDGKMYRTESLDGITVICDESSMLDSMLLAEVVQRKPKRLVLVGDQSQLPPVGRGAPFWDLLTIRPELCANLTTCYRATEAVFSAASIIRAGDRPPLSATSPGEKWTMMNTGDAKQTQQTILEWVDADMFDFEEDIIICARNGENDSEPCTVRGLNKAISELILPRTEKEKFKVGDRVMNTKNVPELDFWNGSQGTIHAIDIDGGIWIESDIPLIDKEKTTDETKPQYTNHVLFGKDIRKHLQLAYAITCHKSQGSQFRRVLMCCFNRDNFGLLDRSLLYTGVTRTKSACCVVGELSAVYKAIDTVKHKRTILQILSEQE
jgi:exodeoxyribonuclease V alpha subunit